MLSASAVDADCIAGGDEDRVVGTARAVEAEEHEVGIHARVV